MRYLYSLVLYLSVPLMLVHLTWRGLRNRAYWRRWAERFGFFESLPRDKRCIWIHAVSVGEVQAAVPVVRGLLERYPDHLLLVTTTTPTGFERVRFAFGDSVVHRYVPYDLPDAVNRFLDRARPDLAMIIETEFWPNLFHYCRKRSVMLLLANVRLSEKSAAGYARFGKLVSEMLGNVTAVAAQGEDDATRLVELGLPAERLCVTGSVKFDIRLPASLSEQAQVLRRDWGVARGVWVAASTHEGEEEMVLQAFEQVRAALPDVLLVLVPRHPERFGRINALCRRRGFSTAQRSRKRGSFGEVEVLVGDTMGELPLFYAAADAAFVGGSLVPIGGHNMLEPAALGIPIVVGPHLFNFAEISRRLFDVGAAIAVTDATALGDEVTRLLCDANLRHSTGEKGRRFVDRNRGAGEQVLAVVDRLMAKKQRD